MILESKTAFTEISSLLNEIAVLHLQAEEYELAMRELQAALGVTPQGKFGFHPLQLLSQLRA